MFEAPKFGRTPRNSIPLGSSRRYYLAHWPPFGHSFTPSEIIIGAFELQTSCNTAPTITAAAVSVQKGSASSNKQIATVSDAEDAESALGVKVDGGTSSTRMP
jgi:hypothetical protein